MDLKDLTDTFVTIEMHHALETLVPWSEAVLRTNNKAGKLEISTAWRVLFVKSWPVEEGGLSLMIGLALGDDLANMEGLVQQTFYGPGPWRAGFKVAEFRSFVQAFVLAYSKMFLPQMMGRLQAERWNET